MECPNDDAYMTNARAAVHEGYTLIIGVGWRAADSISAIATEYPDAAEYAIIDTTVNDENVTSINYKMEESCYVLGVLMGACFPNERIYGIIGSYQTQKTYEQRWGYMEGIKSVNPKAEFVFNFVNSYTEPIIAKEFALQQMAQGCKVICAMAATAGNEGIAMAALENPGKIYTSGQEVDSTKPDNPYILTGMLKNTGVTATYIIDNYFAGTLENGVKLLGLKENGTGVVLVTTDGANYRSELVTDEAITKAKEAANKIMAGELVLEVPRES
jgi:basic membrane protein A